MADVTTAITSYEESRSDAGEIEAVSVAVRVDPEGEDASARSYAFDASTTDDGRLEVDKFGPHNGRFLHYTSLWGFAAAVEHVRDRGYEVDAGPLLVQDEGTREQRARGSSEAGDGHAEDAPEDDEAETHACETCGDEFDSERGLAIHEGRVHDEADDVDEVSENDQGSEVADDDPDQALDEEVEIEASYRADQHGVDLSLLEEGDGVWLFDTGDGAAVLTADHDSETLEELDRDLAMLDHRGESS
ncbi:hypothetical protein BRC81_02850 [Halobacteriales archaeon QS_1_68_20]|nr:MAG: hypothetical protein BRC81_02850 [Halobacteriales archaeon QS_1_68_20]